MRATLVALLPLLAVSASASLNIRQAGVPQCALDCFAVWGAECGQDAACVCSNEQVRWNLMGCLPVQCSGEDAAAAQAFGEAFCSGAAAPTTTADPSNSVIASGSAASASASATSSSTDEDSGAAAGISEAASSASSASGAASSASAAISEGVSAASSAASAAASITSSPGVAATSASASLSGAVNSASGSVSNIIGSRSSVVAPSSSSSARASSASSSAWAQPTAVAGVMGVLGAAAGALVFV